MVTFSSNMCRTGYFFIQTASKLYLFRSKCVEIVTFSLPAAEDPLKFMDFGDFFFIMDFTGFWSQVPVCPESRRYFCASAKIDGVTRYFTYTGGSFGNCLMPSTTFLTWFGTLTTYVGDWLRVVPVRPR